MSYSAGRLAGMALALLVELYLLVRIVRILGRGTVKVDLMFWTTWYGGLDVTADRATNPILYWVGTLATVLLAILVAVVFALIAVNR